MVTTKETATECTMKKEREAPKVITSHENELNYGLDNKQVNKEYSVHLLFVRCNHPGFLKFT